MEASVATEKAKGLIKIFVNNRPLKVVGKDQTGATIRAAAEVPETFKLYDPEGEEIGLDEQVHVKAGERFIAISGQDVS
jgi:hypothetical protein